jgi:hypothetical protein
MYRRVMTVVFCCLAAGGVDAATHSAWSTPIPWDATSATRALTERHSGATFMTATPSPSARRAGVRFDVPVGHNGARRVIEVFNVNGALVATLRVDGATMATWDTSPEGATPVPAGAYVARLVADGSVSSVGFVLPR